MRSCYASEGGEPNSHIGHLWETHVPESTSIQLLKRVSDSRETQSWATFLQYYEPFIDRQLRAVGLQFSDVNDVRQSVMCVLVRELGKFNHNGNKGAFRCWLRRIVANQLHQHRRARGRSGAAESSLVATLASELVDADSALAKQWDQEHRTHLIATLLKEAEPRFSRASFQAFHRQFIDGASPSEVAAELGRSTESVIASKYRVLCALRKLASHYRGFD